MILSALNASPPQGIMQLYMWQPGIVGIAHNIMDWFDLLDAGPHAHD